MIINWSIKEILIAQADLAFVSGTFYTYDTNVSRLAMKVLEASEEGIIFLDTNRHNTTVTVAGTTYARTIEIINGYTITFENLVYSVQLEGSNNNMWDIGGGILNQNLVQVIPTNSAGLIVVTSGSGITEQDKLDIADRVWDETLTGATHNIPTSAGKRLQALSDPIEGKVDDLAATTLSFVTDLNAIYDDHYSNQTLTFIDGDLSGVSRVIFEFNKTTGLITLDEALPAPPADTVSFIINPIHVHPVSEIADAVWDAIGDDYTTTGTLGANIQIMLEDISYPITSADVGGETHLTIWTDDTLTTPVRVINIGTSEIPKRIIVP